MSDHVPPTKSPTGGASGATTRRTVLRSAGLIALAGGSAASLGACGADAGTAAPSSAAPTTAAPASSAPSPTVSTPVASPPEPSSTRPSTSAPAAPSGPSVSTGDVPVGGGVILDDADFVVTQPSKGEYKAFSKICTHQGCKVADVDDGTINCNCHGSRFSIEDGSVSRPPASKPLKESKVTVFDNKVYVTD